MEEEDLLTTLLKEEGITEEELEEARTALYRESQAEQEFEEAFVEGRFPYP
jgi:hypothetical protein